LLLPINYDEPPLSGYWDSIKLLSHPFDFDQYDTNIRTLEALYLSLRYKFDANLIEFYKFNQSAPEAIDTDYQLPRPKIIWHYRSIVNYVASSYIINREPTNIFLPRNEIYFPLTTSVLKLQAPTRTQHSLHLCRKVRVHIPGIPTGVNNHFVFASDLTRYGIKFQNNSQIWYL
jgi:hypothetical protein